MRNWMNFAGLAPSRRDMLALLGGAAALGAMPSQADAQAEPTEASVLHDPDNPVLGNPDGDISIVEWFDFNCPYCRKLEPELRQVVHDDGNVRLILKDWPILGPVSVVAARVALACKYQDKYEKAHDAMIGVSSKLTEPRIYELIARAGIDVDRAKQDLATNAKAIDGMLARNNETAEALSFQGTPSFIVGKFRVPGVLTMDQFAQVIADARKAKVDKATKQGG
ncbi:MAG: DsbA family protein [Bradyrhizobium sp.]|nr:DsbA family protein [Bradyrhizobium sp.]